MKKILSLVVLMMLCVMGVNAQEASTYKIDVSASGQKASLAEAAALPYETTLSACYQAATGMAPNAMFKVTNAAISSGTNVTLGELNGWNTTLTVTDEGATNIQLTLNMGSSVITITATKNATKAIFLKPGVWDAADATERYAAWVWKDAEDGSWLDFAPAEEDGVYTVAIPADKTGLILVRMNGETTENNWDNKWNQTADIDFTTIADNTLFTITDWGSEKSPFETSEYVKPVEPVLNTYTATFATNFGWENVYAYAWSGDGETAVKFLGDWPGTKLNAVREYVYALTFKAENAPEKIIFNNGITEGEGKAQTADLDFESGKVYTYIKEIEELKAAIAEITAINKQLQDADLAAAIENANQALNVEITSTDELDTAAQNLKDAANKLVEAAVAAGKKVLQPAIEQAKLLNQYASDEALAAAIADAETALTSGNAADLLPAAKTLEAAAINAAKTVLAMAVELGNTFGLDVTAAQAVLDKEDATVQELAAALQTLVEKAKPAAKNVLETAQKFFKTFDGDAAKELEEDFAAAAAALNGTDINAMKSAAEALIKKATPAAKSAMEKLIEYFEIINDEPIKTDVAALKAAMEANNLQGIFAAAQQLQTDFPAAAATYVNNVKTIAEKKTYGEKGIDELNAAIATAQAAIAAEDATIVQIGLAIRNLVLAVEAYQEANAVYTVAGNASFFGETEWAVTEANNMVKGEDGILTKTYEGVELTQDYVVQYKIVRNTTEWIPAGADLTYKVWEGDGKYDVTFTYNPVTKEAACDMKKQVVLNTYTATFTTNAGWEEVYAYAWSGDGDAAVKFLGDWPGTKLEAAEGVYNVTIEAAEAPEKIIFNNGDKGQQTADLAFENGKAYEYTIVPPVLAEGKYYLYNVAAKGYVVGANNWGTRASVSPVGGVEMEAKLADGKYELSTASLYAGKKLGFNGYVDNGDANQYWTLTPVEGQEGVFTMSSDGTKVLFWDGGEATTTTVGAMPETAENAYWKFISAEERLASLAAATPENPVDATFLISNPNFSRNASNAAWKMEATNQNLQGGADENKCAESYHAVFTLSQVLANAPAGKYELTAQGFYRQDDGKTEVLPVIYANNSTSEFPAKAGTENNMTDASNSFLAGQYSITPVEVTVYDEGQLTIGAKGTATSQWVIFDNFRLTYLTSEIPAEEFKAAYQEALAEAKGLLEKPMNADVKTNLNTVIEANSTVEETKDALVAATEALQTAIDKAKVSIAAYEVIKANIEKASEINTAINVESLTNDYNNGAYAEDFNAKTIFTLFAKLAIEQIEATAGADFTAAIVNPSFETGDLTGWTAQTDGDTGIKPNSNGTYHTEGCDGDYLYNTWNGDATGYAVKQTLSGMPNGTYKLTAMFAGRLDSNVDLIANSASTTVTHTSVNVGTDYSVEFNCVDGTIELGTANPTGWYKADNFRLIFVDAVSIDVYVAEYEKALAAAQDAAKEKMSKTTLAALNAVIEANSTVDKTSKDALLAAIDALNKGTEAAQPSINSYKILAAGVPDDKLDNWTCTNTNTFHINTWSTEGNAGNDPSGMVTPFIENWVGKPGPLGEGVITYTLPGIDPGNYNVGALIRVYSESGSEPAGATFFANDAEKDIAAQGTNFEFNGMKGVYGSYCAVATVGEDEVLKIGVKIADPTFNWVAIKNVKIMEEAVYTVAGGFNTTERGVEDAIFTTSWDPTIEANDMAEQDGIYTKKYENVSLEAGTILYKVVANHDWSNTSWGFADKEGGNADYVVNEAGIYNITFTFNPVALLSNGYNLACELEKKDATGISTVAAEAVENGNVYNLSGQRVVKAQKGLYIINGRKQVVK